MILLTAASANHGREAELCLKMCIWAEPCAILDERYTRATEPCSTAQFRMTDPHGLTRHPGSAYREQSPRHRHHVRFRQWSSGTVLSIAQGAVQVRAERETGAIASLCSVRKVSAGRSPMMMQGAMVFPLVTRGMIEPSATRRFSIP
jgi:hypothetical protein